MLCRLRAQTVIFRFVNTWRVLPRETEPNARAFLWPKLRWDVRFKGAARGAFVLFVVRFLATRGLAADVELFLRCEPMCGQEWSTSSMVRITQKRRCCGGSRMDVCLSTHLVHAC